MPMPCAEIQHIAILSQGVIVFKHCYFDLQVNVKTQRSGCFLIIGKFIGIDEH